MLDGFYPMTPNLNGNYSQITGATFSQITGATFSLNGNLLIGSQNTDVIYEVDIVSDMVSVFDANSPLFGGDIAATSSGMFYMSTNSNGGALYEVYPDSAMADILLASTPPSTGLTATDTDHLLLSVRNNTGLGIWNTDGTNAGSRNLMLDGEEFTLNYGDLASGCNTYEMPHPGECDNLVSYYAHFDAAMNETDVYEVDFAGNMAHLTPFSTLMGNVSIAYDGDGNVLYGIEKSTTFSNGLSLYSITAAVFNANNGLLYIADDVTNAIYTLDITTGDAVFYADGFVRGGDLAIASDGSVYLATQTDNSLYEIGTSGSSSFVSGIPALVTGAARSNTSMGIILSNVGSNVFTEINVANGTPINVYPTILEGAPFELQFGDLASGCAVADVLPSLVVDLSTIEWMGTQSTLTSLPNPTTGLSQVIFKTAETGRTLVEVFDAAGRNIAVLFNKEAQQSEEYCLQFDGSYLPNGIYVYRLTTGKEIIIDKFMIAR
jgi:hypothetical protein